MCVCVRVWFLDWLDFSDLFELKCFDKLSCEWAPTIPFQMSGNLWKAYTWQYFFNPLDKDFISIKQKPGW